MWPLCRKVVTIFLKSRCGWCSFHQGTPRMISWSGRSATVKRTVCLYLPMCSLRVTNAVLTLLLPSATRTSTAGVLGSWVSVGMLKRSRSCLETKLPCRPVAPQSSRTLHVRPQKRPRSTMPSQAGLTSSSFCIAGVSGCSWFSGFSGGLSDTCSSAIGAGAVDMSPLGAAVEVVWRETAARSAGGQVAGVAGVPGASPSEVGGSQ